MFSMQVCYHYGDLRDDYALVHYGFTVGGEAGVAGPLCSVDHPDFVDGREELPTSQFSGTGTACCVHDPTTWARVSDRALQELPACCFPAKRPK